MCEVLFLKHRPKLQMLRLNVDQTTSSQFSTSRLLKSDLPSLEATFWCLHSILVASHLIFVNLPLQMIQLYCFIVCLM